MKHFGLVGVGAWGRRYVQTIARRTDCEIVSYARTSGAAADVLPNAKHVASWRMLLDAKDEKLDGLIVATTPDNQAEVALAASIAGIPVLVEKPLGATRATAEAVLTAMRAAAAPAPALVDYVHLFAPAWHRLKGLASSGIVAIETAGHNAGPYRGWSPLHDYASHDVAMCLDLLGRDASFELRDVRRVSPPESPGVLYDIRFALAGIPIRLLSGNGAETKARKIVVRLEGDRELVYDDLVAHPNKLTDGGKPVEVDPKMPLDAAVDRFVALCDAWSQGKVEKEPAVASVALATRVAEILDAFDRYSDSS